MYNDKPGLVSKLGASTFRKYRSFCSKMFLRHVVILPFLSKCYKLPYKKFFSRWNLQSIERLKSLLYKRSPKTWCTIFFFWSFCVWNFEYQAKTNERSHLLVGNILFSFNDRDLHSFVINITWMPVRCFDNSINSLKLRHAAFTATDITWDTEDLFQNLVPFNSIARWYLIL